MFRVPLTIVCFLSIGLMQACINGIFPIELIQKITIGLSVLGMVSEGFDFLKQGFLKIFKK